jgi:hypothetical protein
MLAKKAPLVVLDLRGSDLEVSEGLVGSTSFDIGVMLWSHLLAHPFKHTHTHKAT